MPLTLTKETVQEYDVRTVSLDADACEEMLRERLEARLTELLESKEGEILNMDFTAVRWDGILTVTLEAECSEQIGQSVPFEGEIGRTLPEQES